MLLTTSGGTAVSAVTNIAYVGGDTKALPTGADTTLILPTHAADHYGIITWFSSPDITVTMTTPTGWTSVRQDVYNASGPDDDSNAGIYVRRFTSSSETNPAMSTSTGNAYITSVHVFSGVTTTGTALQALDATTTYSTSSDIWTPTPPAITTATNGALVFMWFGESQDKITAISAPTTPSGSVMGRSNISVLDGQMGHAYATIPTAGTVTPSAFNGTGSDINKIAIQNYTMAIKRA